VDDARREDDAALESLKVEGPPAAYALMSRTEIASAAKHSVTLQKKVGRLRANLLIIGRPQVPDKVNIGDFRGCLANDQDQDQPIAAVDWPCEKPPTATRMHLIVRPACETQRPTNHRTLVARRAFGPQIP
jgi:hypothetical protein